MQASRTSSWNPFRRSSIALVLGVAAVTLVRSVFATDNAVVVEKNLTYGTVGGVDLKLDLAHPKEGSGPFPAIIFIHGGAWAGGDRNVYSSQIERAARKGYVAATISYRLTDPDPKTKLGKFPFPAQLHDCKCAVRWMRSVADKYHVDTERIGVTGGSAGGHLCLLVGLVDEKAGLEGTGGHANQSSRVRAVVNYCGPTELTREYREVQAVQPFLVALCGGTPESAAASYRAASPITYISANAPPVLTLHGDKDDIVPISQAKLLDQALKAAGLEHELVILPGQGHGIKGQLADISLWNFFEKHLKANATATLINTVSGRVTLDGQPVKEGCVVNFVPKSPAAELACGRIEEDGKFVAASQKHLGVQVGDYEIEILPPAANKSEQDEDRKKIMGAVIATIGKKRANPALPSPILPKFSQEAIVPFKYWSETTSKLKFKVQHGENTANFELTSKE
jgi:acetyl esterase/lipase